MQDIEYRSGEIRASDEGRRRENFEARASGGWLLVSDWPNKPPRLHDSGERGRTKVLSKRPAFFSASGAAFSVVAGPAAAGAGTFSWVTSGCPARVLAPTSGCAAGFCDGADMASVERVATGVSTRRRVSRVGEERRGKGRGREQENLGFGRLTDGATFFGGFTQRRFFSTTDAL